MIESARKPGFFTRHKDKSYYCSCAGEYLNQSSPWTADRQRGKSPLPLFLWNPCRVCKNFRMVWAVNGLKRVCLIWFTIIKYLVLFNKAPGPALQSTADNGGIRLPLPMANETYIELTVEQAILCLMAQTVTKPISSRQYQATRSIQEQLKIVFGVEVSLRRIQQILKHWRRLDIIGETEQPLKLRVPIHGPKTICFYLKHPEKIIRCKKFKREKGVWVLLNLI